MHTLRSPWRASTSTSGAPAERRPPLRGVVAATVIGHTVIVLVWLVALLFLRDRWWPFILANFAVVEPILMAVAIAIAAIATRERRLVGIAAVPLVIYAVLYWPYAVPDLAEGPDPATHPDLRVVTFNILNDNDDLPAVLAVIDRFEPDIVAIQELTAARAPDFRSALVDTHPHSIVAKPHPGGTTALFSRTPMTTTELDFGIDRPAVLGTTTIDGHDIVVVSAHLNPAYYARTEPSWFDRPGAFDRYASDQQSQADQLVAELARYPDHAAFVGCDCNTHELNRTNEILSGSLVDPTRELGIPLRRTALPGTVHERRIAHIDYIWFRSESPAISSTGSSTGDLSTTEVTVEGIYRVEDRGGSDHHPLIADFSLGGSGAAD